MSACNFCSRQMKQPISIAFVFSFRPVSEPTICDKCKDKFQKIISDESCPGCAREQTNCEMCADCKKWQEVYPNILLNHAALFSYNETARAFMNDYKFKGDIKLAEVFSEILNATLTSFLSSHIITVVPASKKSLENRGFNAVQLLLDYAEIPYVSLLSHQNFTGLQSSKNRSERLKTKQPFALTETEIELEKGKSILLIDDVYTTGRTILHARILLENLLPTESMTLFR